VEVAPTAAGATSTDAASSALAPPSLTVLSAVREVAPRALLAFLVGRLTCFAAFALGSSLPGGPALRDVRAGHDGVWYLGIVDGGYPSHLPVGPTGIVQNRTGFFPLFPLVVRAVSAVPRVTTLVASLAVVTLLAAVATVGVAVVVRQFAGPREAAAVALLVSFSPASYVFSLPYSESLFLALAAGCLLALLRQRWLLAGLAALGASATRTTGIVLALCCLVAALQTRQVRAFVAVVLAPLGAVAFFVFLRVRTGRFDAYVASQRQGWGTYIDGGATTARTLAHTALHPLERPSFVAVAGLIVLALIGLVLFLRDRAPAVIVAYTVGLVVLALTSAGTYSATPRLLLPAFPLLLPLVRRVRTSLPTIVAGSAVLLGASTVVVAVSNVITP